MNDHQQTGGDSQETSGFCFGETRIQPYRTVKAHPQAGYGLKVNSLSETKSIYNLPADCFRNKQKSWFLFDLGDERASQLSPEATINTENAVRLRDRTPIGNNHLAYCSCKSLKDHLSVSTAGKFANQGHVEAAQRDRFWLPLPANGWAYARLRQPPADKTLRTGADARFDELVTNRCWQCQCQKS